MGIESSNIDRIPLSSRSGQKIEDPLEERLTAKKSTKNERLHH